MTPAQALTNRIRNAASPRGARLFPMTTGKFWAGRVISQTSDTVTLKNPRLVNVGFKGLSDLMGGSPVTITPDMVGQTVFVLTAVEVKEGNDRPTPEQLKFIERVQEWGGRAGIAKSEDDAVRICEGG